MSQTVHSVLGVIEIEIDYDRLNCFVDADCWPDQQLKSPSSWADVVSFESGRFDSVDDDSSNNRLGCDDSIVIEPVHLLAADLATLRRELAAELLLFRNRLQRAKRVG